MRFIFRPGRALQLESAEIDRFKADDGLGFRVFQRLARTEGLKRGAAVQIAADISLVILAEEYAPFLGCDNAQGIVELVFFDDKKTVVERQRPGGRENAPANAVNVALDFRIVRKFKLLLSLAAELAADSSLVVFARCTDGWQHRGDDRAATADQ